MAETISGYAVRFNDITTIANTWRERIAVGCFDRTLRDQPDVIMLLDHDSGRVLGRTTAGTLTLRPDRIGLWFSLDVDTSTPEGQSALGTVRRQDVKGCSFGFRVRSEEWDDGGRRLPLRTITDVDLFEITLTAFPAYPTTSASVRAAGEATAARRLRERVGAAMRARGIPLS